jgi:hypothetical protein
MICSIPQFSGSNQRRNKPFLEIFHRTQQALADLPPGVHVPGTISPKDSSGPKILS